MLQSEPSPDAGIIADSYGPALRITTARAHIFGRLVSENKPQRLHQVKGAISVARQVARRSSSPVNEAIFFGSSLLDEGAAISQMMPEYARVHTAPLSLFSVIDVLMSIRNPSVLVAIGEARAPRDELIVALANVIDGLHADTRSVVLTALLAELEKTRNDIKSGENELVIQEKPGKFSVIKLPDEVALKAAQRRVQTELSNFETKRDYLAKISAEDGWASGGVVIEEVNTDNPRAIRIAAATFRWKGQQLSLQMPKAMAAKIISWFEGASGCSGAALTQISASAQSVAVAGRLAIEICEASRAPKRPHIHFPDFGLGWMPVASLLSGLVDTKVPALFVFCETFPTVEVLAVWR